MDALVPLYYYTKKYVYLELEGIEMKVSIGKYLNWVGPYQIAEVLLFWMDQSWDKKDPRVHNFGNWLATNKKGEDSLLTEICEWIQSKKKRKIKVHIDNYDVWSMDSTLALIILPMLKKLKEEKNGSPFTDLDDLPQLLRIAGYEDCSIQSEFEFEDHKEYTTNSWELHQAKWDWILDEMIWTFEQLVMDDWEGQYTVTHGEIDFEDYPEDEGKDVTPFRWKTKGKYDYEGIKKHQNRINNGLLLFGKYFQNLWD